MTGGPHEPALHLVADLRVDVDGVPARVSGDGQRLVIDTDRPVRLARAALRSVPPGPTGARGLASTIGDLLAGQGLTVDVVGPRGRLARIGADADSSVGAIVTGTRRVSLTLPPVAVRLAGAAALTYLVVRWRRR